MYLARLHSEIRDFFLYHPSEKIESIYFGGGTPSLLSLEEIEDILGVLRQLATFAPDIEISMEMFPKNVEEKYVAGLSFLGVNRLSVGIQTLQESSLACIGRTSITDIYETLDILKRCYPHRVSVDFIAGLPHTNAQTTQQDIQTILEKYPNIGHISLYMLEE